MYFNLYFSKRNDWFNLESDELFHFTKLTSFRSIMESNTLRFRKNNYSNDESDGKISVHLLSVIENMNLKYLKDTIYWEAFSTLLVANFKLYEQLNLTKHPNDYYLHSMPTFYNLCFTTENNEYMWSEYGDSGNGISIGFSKSLLKRFLDYPDDENKNKYLFCTCGKVIYDDETKFEILTDLIINAYGEYCIKYPTDKVSDLWEKLLSDLLLCSFFFKDEQKWNKENEFRFILLHTRNLTTPSIDDSGNPYIDFNFNKSINLRKAAIKNIFYKNEAYIELLSKYEVNSFFIERIKNTK